MNETFLRFHFDAIVPVILVVHEMIPFMKRRDILDVTFFFLRIDDETEYAIVDGTIPCRRAGYFFVRVKFFSRRMRDMLDMIFFILFFSKKIYNVIASEKISTRNKKCTEKMSQRLHFLHGAKTKSASAEFERR